MVVGMGLRQEEAQVTAAPDFSLVGISNITALSSPVAPLAGRRVRPSPHLLPGPEGGRIWVRFINALAQWA